MSNCPRCLYCNTELRPETRTVEREPTDADYLRRKEAQEAAAHWERERVASLDAQDFDGAIRASQRASRIRRRAPHIFIYDGKDICRAEIPTGRYGRDGNGFFCTRRCGEAFGIESARAGYRIKRVERLNK